MKYTGLGLLVLAMLLPACGAEEAGDGDPGFVFNAADEFAKYDSDNDGRITTGEWLAQEGEGPVFGTLDKDGNHEIDEEEFNGLGVILEEEHNAESNDGPCLVGLKICSTAGVFECQSDGSMLPVDGCGSGMSCNDGVCTEDGGSVVPSEVALDYPEGPYGYSVGDVIENAQFVDPNTGESFKVGQHYGEEGILALIAANGW